MQAGAAEQPLINHHPLAQTLRLHLRPERDDLAGDLVTEYPARLSARNFAAARENVVMADARGINANEDIIRARFGTIDLRGLQHFRTAEVAERHGPHERHSVRRPAKPAAPSL